MFLYSYWIGLHIHFKKAILHLKRAKVRILFLLSVFVLVTTVKVTIMQCHHFSSIEDLGTENNRHGTRFTYCTKLA